MSDVDVFISWSGEESRAIGHKLKAFLRSVLPTLEVFLSTEDISSGERWLLSVSKALETARFGIIVLTPQNLAKPWIHFEAGALSKSVSEGRVVPLLCGLTPVNLRDGPLSGFQAERLDRGGIFGLISAVRAATAFRIDDQALAEAFEVWWEKKGADLETIPPSIGDAGETEPAQVTLDDVFIQVSELEAQLREMGRDVRSLIAAATESNLVSLTSNQHRGLFGGGGKSHSLDTDALWRALSVEHVIPSSKIEGVVNEILQENRAASSGKGHESEEDGNGGA